MMYATYYGASMGQIAASGLISFVGDSLGAYATGIESMASATFRQAVISGVISGGISGGLNAMITGTRTSRGILQGMAVGAVTAGIAWKVSQSPAKNVTDNPDPRDLLASNDWIYKDSDKPAAPLGPNDHTELSPDEIEDLGESIRKDATRLLAGVMRRDPGVAEELHLNLTDKLAVTGAEFDLPRIGVLAFSDEMAGTLYDWATVIPAEVAKNVIANKGVIWKGVAQTALDRLFGPGNNVSHTIQCPNRCTGFIKINEQVFQFYPK